ncbi:MULTISPECIES: 3-deoxy-manno-octulosonate cytidylyltransferase [unclassified Helicobacter]|uniref:3-deoxy-manno-octulosonate cytidylyltransferase n=1 Tax=unclassified Helicobacter TaxID=2593540 RepID=UPI000804B71C|nr:MULTISPECIES: 3-deoxy-manno-octulosonate cytidylyltransferase [unclassified Helicobacter]OBV28696.1 3-deoxy-D-manno-octulosonate cytidylyltransferase [Helicobacter sp. CLO-3]
MIIIPARLASTRFPRKILADIGGLPMLIKTAQNAMKNDEVCVACDDESVLEVCKLHGVRAVMTSQSHQSGTDRCNEAAQILGLSDDEIIINIQADEPFLESHVIEALQGVMKRGAWMGSCAKRITQAQTLDPNLVKVVLNSANEAIYFSRSIIPYDRDYNLSRGKNAESKSTESSKVESKNAESKKADSSTIDSSAAESIASSAQYLGHLGVYGYSARSLKEFCALPSSTADSPLEHIEKLEQLRAIYHKKPIAMTIVATESVGIDTPEDLERALRLFGA